ncbi:Uncharacterized protein FKW44_019065, partial [Caligus rogercresseyi]
ANQHFQKRWPYFDHSPLHSPLPTLAFRIHASLMTRAGLLACSDERFREPCTTIGHEPKENIVQAFHVLFGIARKRLHERLTFDGRLYITLVFGFLGILLISLTFIASLALAVFNFNALSDVSHTMHPLLLK